MDKALHHRADTILDASMRDNEEFGEITPLPDALLPVEAFDYRLLPDGPVARHIQDIAERMQCPPDYAAMTMMISLAAVIGCSIQITPKQYDKSWRVVPNLWGIVIGRPSMLKTPSLEEALYCLKCLESDSQREYEDAVQQYNVDAKFLELQSKDTEKKVKALLAKGKESQARELLATNTSEIQPPTRKRYMVGDATIEKIGELLKENPNGLLCKRDELSGFLRTIDNESRPNDRAFYLEGFNGSGSYVYDRIGRGTIDIPNHVISMIGTIQPGRYANYVDAAIRQGQGDDGLSQRFQLAVFPNEPKKWKNVDREHDQEAKEQVASIFQALVALVSKIEEPTVVSFSTEAQEIFNQWREELENEKLCNTDEHPALVSHLAKYRSLMPSLALIIHLVDCCQSGVIPPVSATAAGKACAFCEYLESHAQRIYGMAINNPTEAANLILRKIKAGNIVSGFTVRHIQHKNWSGLNVNEKIKEGLGLLVDHNYLKEELVLTGGRNSLIYHINPAIFGC